MEAVWEGERIALHAVNRLCVSVKVSFNLRAPLPPPAFFCLCISWGTACLGSPSRILAAGPWGESAASLKLDPRFSPFRFQDSRPCLLGWRSCRMRRKNEATFYIYSKGDFLDKSGWKDKGFAFPDQLRGCAGTQVGGRRRPHPAGSAIPWLQLLGWPRQEQAVPSWLPPQVLHSESVKATAFQDLLAFFYEFMYIGY